MQKFLNYEGLQTLVERIKSCYLLEIGVSGGAGAIMVDSTADRAEINAIVEGNAPMPIAVKLHMADNDTDYIVNTCQVRGGYFMLYIPDDMVLTDIDGTEFTGTWMTFMADSFTAAVDYYATSVDLRNSTQVITDTSKATSSNVLYLVADSSKNVSGVVYNSKTYTFAAEKGEKGDKGDTGATGVGITSVKQTVASMISGDTNVVEITTSDGKTSQVKIRNGNASTSGTEIVQTAGTATDKVMSQKAVTDALDFPRVTLKVTFLTEVIKGKSVGGNGTLYNQAYHEVTCHIPCEGAHKVEIIIGAPSSSTWLLAAFYDADGKFLNTCTVYGGAKRTFTSPATSAYLVATYLADTTEERGVWIDGVKVHEPVPDDIEIKHEGGDKEYYLMSQKGVHDYVNQRLMDSAQSHTSFGSGFCYKLNARQIELLEASDVITLEICAQTNGGLNGYNNTAAMGYFSIMFGNNHGALTTSYSGQLSYSSDQKKYPQGSGFTYAVDGGIVTCWDRFIVVINRKTGVIRLYDKCSRMVAEKQREEYKSDTWLGGDDWLVVSSDNYPSDIWAVRIYDRDVTILQYDNSFRVKDAHMTEAILPFQHPIIAKTIDVKDWQKEKFDKATQDNDYGKPYHFPGTYSYDPDDGLLTGTNDTSDWAMIGPGSSRAGNLYGIIDVDFEVSGGKWRVAKQTAIKVYAITKADGTDMGIEGIFSYGSDRTELEAGRYTMSYISFNANAFCDIAPGAKIKMHSMHQHTLHCVCNINPRYWCNGQCWDDARQEWWTPLNVNNHSTPVVPTFTDAAWRAVPAPSLLSQPSFNGQIKVDDSGKVYVGVCTGATRTWKQINNT